MKLKQHSVNKLEFSIDEFGLQKLGANSMWLLFFNEIGCYFFIKKIIILVVKLVERQGSFGLIIICPRA